VSIILVGLNHRTAPVALREQLSITGCALDMAFSELSALKGDALIASDEERAGGIHECVILSTCNRLEIYATANDPCAGSGFIETYLCRFQGLESSRLHPHLYVRQDAEAVEHLMRVVAGLDSMILGEPQILGQVSEALARAQSVGAAGLVLSQLFASAVHAGKRARSETAISRHTTSVSHAAAHLARNTLGDLGEVRVLIVGAGEMAELAASALVDEGARHVTCINRTYSGADRLAGRFGGRALNWSHLPEALVDADVIVAATGAPHTVIYRDDVAQALTVRNGKPLVIFDIALPRDVEVAAGELPGVLRFDIDHLKGTVDANLAQREAAVPDVEAILAQEAAGFSCWMRGREVVPVLVDLRRMAHHVATSELNRVLRRLDNPDPRIEQMMALLAHRIVGKLLHEPTVRLKSEAASGNGVVYADALRELFALDADDPIPCESPESAISVR